MAFEFKMPDLGENIETADVGKILVSEGESIEANHIVLELETEKAVFELPCPEGGTVEKLLVKPGDKVSIGAPLLLLNGGSEAKKRESGSVPAKTPAALGKPTGTTGAAVTDTVATQLPTSALRDMPPPRHGPGVPGGGSVPPATQTNAPPPAAEVGVGASGADHPEVPATREGMPQTAESSPQPAPTDSGPKRFPAPASPATRRLARELGVDLYQVKGTGPGKRITTEDIHAHVRNVLVGSGATSPSAASAATGLTVAVPPLPDFAQFGKIDREPLNKIARTAANNLSIAWQVVPHVTQHDLVDVTALEEARQRFVKARKDAPKVTMTVLAMKAVVNALKAYPHVNASLDSKKSELILKGYYHIGVAVDTEHGLVVPVIREVDKKNVLQLAAELTEVANRARARQLTPSDFAGGSFTISNLGGIGGSFFTPIVNYPEVAILGMSRTTWQSVIRDGKPEARLMLPLSFSYDHRVINGADGARFITKLAQSLADPFNLLVET